jgi:hypothetical protein
MHLAALIALMALLVTSTGMTALPAPDGERQALARFEMLKKELPNLIATWAKDRLPFRPFGGRGGGFSFQTAKLRYFRQIGDREAKATLLLDYGGDAAKRPTLNLLLTIRLRCFNGIWSTVDCEGTWGDSAAGREHTKEATLYLLLAIDEAGAK